MPSPPSRVPTRATLRFLRAYFTTFLVLGSYAWLNFKSRLFGDAYRDRLIGDVHERNARRVENTILKLQGLFIKVGQLFSIMTNFLPEEFRAGLVELIKHGFIRDKTLLQFIEDNAERMHAAEAELMAEMIGRNVAIKAAVVAADERESSERAHLNFGHTVAHALEAAAAYAGISHGQAVSLGMVAACELAVRRGLVEAALARRLREVLVRLGLPVRFADLPDLPPAARDPGRLREIMSRDIWWLIGITVLMFPMMLSGKKVNRWEGFILLAAITAYIVMLLPGT